MYFYQMDIEEYLVSILLEENDQAGQAILNEAKQRGAIHLIGKYSANIHPPHIPQGKKHIEVYAKNNILFAMNVDGTAHDSSHRIRIPNKVTDVLRSEFPEFNIPRGGIIESIDQVELDSEQKRLLEILLNYLIK